MSGPTLVMRGLTNEQVEEPGRAVCRKTLWPRSNHLGVRWYLRYKISLRDLVEMIAERGLQLAPTTILCWVRRHAQSSSNAGTVSVEARTKIHLVTGMSIKT